MVYVFFFFQAEDGIRDVAVTGVQTCALPLFKKNKVEWVQGWGRYEGPGKISVEKDGKKTTIEAANVLLVSGSEAKSLPGIEPDHKTILTNRSILELPEIPKSMIVVGAGAVGVEFASAYNSFGTQVTILEALPRVVPLEDEEISAELTKAFQKKGIQIFTGSSVEAAKKEDRKSTRLNSSHGYISYAVFCLKKKKEQKNQH